MTRADWPYSTDTYEAFAALRESGWTHYCCGDRKSPHVLISAHDWGGCIDVINIRGADQATAARLPKHDGLDIFAPTLAVWHYMGTLPPTVTAILRLPPPDHPEAPTTCYPAPPTLFMATGEQRPMTIRPGRRA